MSDTNCKIKLANLIIEIENPSTFLLDRCNEYIVSTGYTDIFIAKTTKEEIYYEREIANNQRVLDNLSQVDYPDDYLEYISVYRKIVETIPHYGALLIHGAAISVDNRAFLFLAKSGVGKTTHIMNWLKILPNTLVINGDKPIIDIKNMMVCGTPWSGKENLNTNIQVPLAGFCFLQQGGTNIISKVEGWDSAIILNNQIYWPKSQNMRRKTIKLIDELKEIPFYRMICTPSIDAAKIAYATLKQEAYSFTKL